MLKVKGGGESLVATKNNPKGTKSLFLFFKDAL